MIAYRLSFYTTLARRCQGRSMKDWLVGAAQDFGVSVATLSAGASDFDPDDARASRDTESADEPVVVVMFVTGEQRTRMLSRVGAIDGGVCLVTQPVDTAGLF